MQNKNTKNKNILFKSFRNPVFRLITISLVSVLVIGVSVPPLVHAVACTTVTDCQQQISNLNSQNSNSKQALNSLILQAQGYQGAINSLQAQISSLQQEIYANQTKQTNLKQQIIANEQAIVARKKSLASDVRAMYIDGSMNTIEQLATSNNLSTYVNKQEYQKVIQDQLNSALQQIANMQRSLQIQKNQVNELLIAENTQNSALATSQAQLSSMLSMTQQQQAAYNNQISATTNQIALLRRQQAAIIQAGTRSVSLGGNFSGNNIGNIYAPTCNSGFGTGGYPTAWCDSHVNNNPVITAGGFPARQCTSYAYWYFTSVEGHQNFFDTGNANQWLANSNYPTHSKPAVGGLAVETAGEYGHVAVVQGLPGQTISGHTVPAGYVLVSEMNYDWNGHFRYSYTPMWKFSGYIY